MIRVLVPKYYRTFLLFSTSVYRGGEAWGCETKLIVLGGGAGL